MNNTPLPQPAPRPLTTACRLDMSALAERLALRGDADSVAAAAAIRDLCQRFHVATPQEADPWPYG